MKEAPDVLNQKRCDQKKKKGPHFFTQSTLSQSNFFLPPWSDITE